MAFHVEATVSLVNSICIIIGISFKTNTKFDNTEDVISNGKKQIRKKWSPVIMQGEGKPGRSTKREESLIPFKDEAIKLSDELCLHLQRTSPRYVLQLATI